VQNEDGTYSRNLSAGDPSAVNATEGAMSAAEELGVDLRSVQGSGKDGRITKADVEAAA
jgi:pyruvate/2-oxoglutarate dehydrogenase complex dihydrolipoamide acyltransferase (E2) component